MQAFRQFRGMTSNQTKIIWTESDTVWPYECKQCRRPFEKGGLRYIGSSIINLSHKPVATICPDCMKGIDPHRKPVPVMAQRTTSLD